MFHPAHASSIHHMERAARILVANELRSYREAIARAIRALRPEIEVFDTEPEFLNRRLLQLRPDLVLCSELTELAHYCAPNWIELYPGHEGRMVIDIAGERTTLADAELSDLLAVIDDITYRHNLRSRRPENLRSCIERA